MREITGAIVLKVTPENHDFLRDLAREEWALEERARRRVAIRAGERMNAARLICRIRGHRWWLNQRTWVCSRCGATSVFWPFKNPWPA